MVSEEIFDVVPKEVVVGIMRNEFQGWMDSLTKAENRAIRKYSKNSMSNKPDKFFNKVNLALRGKYTGQDEDKILRYAEIISSAIDRGVLSHGIVCYRGVDNDYLANYNINDIVAFDQLTSTSVIRSRALKKKYLYIIYAPAGTHGAYIEKISGYPKQREFILSKDCLYKICGKEDSVYTLEVVK